MTRAYINKVTCRKSTYTDYLTDQPLEKDWSHPSNVLDFFESAYAA